MAVVDSLLALIESQRALGLVIASGDVPVLEVEDGARPLSMPAVAHEIVADFLEQVGGEGAGEALLASGSLEACYEAANGSRFVLVARVEGDGFRLAFRPEIEASAGARPQPGAATPTAQVEGPPVDSRPRSAAHADAARLLAVLEGLAREGASDLLLSTAARPRIRVGGRLTELNDAACSETELFALLGDAIREADRGLLAEAGSVDLALDLEVAGRPMRLRANLFRQERGLAVALRPVREEVPTLRELRLPEDFSDLVSHPNGLVLMTGPSGSGKSTTLVALVEHLNRNESRHIITLEDPIEYRYRSRRSMVHQRELGTHVESFAAGLRAALREDPDVILVGEMRDHATIAAALTAAETGHLVLATLHTGSAAMAIDRMIDVFPGPQQGQVRLQLASVLRAVVTQVLLPSRRPPERIPAFEKMVVTSAIANLIRDGRGHQLHSQIQMGRAEGMVSLEMSLAALVRGGLVDREDARRAAANPELLAHLADAR